MNQPQLKMWLGDLSSLPHLQLPDGYALRVFQDGDEDSWADVLNSTTSLGKWDRERVDRQLAGNVPRGGILFITHNGKPVATACVVVHRRENGVEAETGWVGVHPNHQGKRLGYQITLAVLHRIRSMGYNATFLLTDDFRLPAIKTYLNLGFQPDCWHESHEERWEAVRQQLGVSGSLPR